jgi:hypothetical protein
MEQDRVLSCHDRAHAPVPPCVGAQWEFRRHLEAVSQDGDDEREGDFGVRLFALSGRKRALTHVHRQPDARPIRDRTTYAVLRRTG